MRALSLLTPTVVGWARAGLPHSDMTIYGRGPEHLITPVAECATFAGGQPATAAVRHLLNRKVGIEP